MKRRISLLLALVIVLGSFGTAFAAVPTTAQEKAEFLSKEGILKGNKSNELMLDKKENRQNMVVMLSRLMKQETEAKAHGVEEAAKFEDVTNKDYKSYVAWSVANKYIVGKSETLFGAKDNVTAQHYSIVLLRALGYFSAENLKLESEVGFAKAKELGLLEDLDVEAKTEITREQMSVMIYNALGTKMNGSEDTLAKFLGITMPEPDKLTVEVKSENLKEVKLVLNNAKLIKDQKALRDADNYTFASEKVKDVRVNGNEIIVELEKALVAGREYELRVRDVDADLNGSYKFVARDNEAPVALEAKVLGNYGIKVIMSEPVKANEVDFLIDGKNVAMRLDTYGREITLMPYHREAFPIGEHKLTVKPLVDYAGFKSVEKDFDIKIEEINDLPVVKNIDAKHESIIVTFENDVFPKSVDAKNIFWTEYKGRTKVYATDAKVLAGNRVEYTFKNADRLPGRSVEVTVQGVENYSRKEMKAHTEVVYPELDYSRPEVTRAYVKSIDNKENKQLVKVQLRFSKEMNKASVEKQLENIELFSTKHNKFGELVEDKNLRTKTHEPIKSVELVEKDLVEITFTDSEIKAGETYVLKAKNFLDNTLLRNRMLDFEFNFREGSSEDFKVDNIRHNFKSNDKVLEIEVFFTNPVDRKTAETATNYVFTLRNGEIADLADLKGDIVVSRDGKKVTLTLDQDKVYYNNTELKELKDLTVLRSIKDIDGNRLAKEEKYFFKNAFVGKELAELNKAIEQAKEVEPKTEELEKAIKDAKKVEEKGLDATKSEIAKAIADLDAAKEKNNEDQLAAVKKEFKELAAKITGNGDAKTEFLSDEFKINGFGKGWGLLIDGDNYVANTDNAAKKVKDIHGEMKDLEGSMEKAKTVEEAQEALKEMKAKKAELIVALTEKDAK